MINDDDLDDALSPGLRSLLDDGAAGPAMSAEARDRLLSRVLLSVTAATVVASVPASASIATTTTAASATTTASATASATTAGLASALGFKISLAVLGAVAVVGVGSLVTPSLAPAALVAPVVAPAVTASVTASVGEPMLAPVLAPVSAPVSAPAPPVFVAAPPTKKASPTTSSPAAVSATWEVEQLEAARLALSRGDAVGALRVLQEHAAQAPASGMAEERQALQVLSLARAGRLEEARSLSLAFAALYPDSLFLDRVRAATP